MRIIIKKHQSLNQCNGYALVLVVTTLLGGIALTMGTLIRTLNDRQGSQRHSMARQAKAVAEHGIAKLQATLNQNYSGLLVKDDTSWPNQAIKICDNDKTTTTPPADDPFWTTLKTGSISVDEKWSLESYTFIGSSFYGGEGTFLVKGFVEKNGKNFATSYIKQAVSIKPKPCGCRFNDGCSSGFPGLYVQEGTLGGNDVLGKIGGNVLCVKCSSIADLGANPKSVIDGSVYLTQEAIPDIPANPIPIESGFPIFPSVGLRIDGKKCTGNCANVVSLKGSSIVDNYGKSIDTTDSVVIRSQKGKNFENKDTELDGNCIYTKENNTLRSVRDFSGTQLICQVDAMILNNNELIIDTRSEVPVAIYFTGVGDVFKSSGNGGIRHISGSASPVHLQLFGSGDDPDNKNPDQYATIRGAASTNNLFIHFPDGHLGIAGGATSNANCTSPDGECTGGDIYGAVWAKTWGKTSGASSGNGVQIVVPKDLANAIGPQKAYITDYVAIGVNKWSNYQSN